MATQSDDPDEVARYRHEACEDTGGQDDLDNISVDDLSDLQTDIETDIVLEEDYFYCACGYPAGCVGGCGFDYWDFENEY